MATLDKAIIIAAKVHQNQTDRYGKHYILHPIRVMMSVESEKEKIVAILHDVIEDSDWTLEKLRTEGFSKDIINAIDCLTKRNGENYMDYINRTKADNIARKVKIADLEDNMNIKRVKNLNDKDSQRIMKYHRAWEYLKGIDEHTR